MNGVALSLEGKVALITGGSRGIGAACVRMFRQAGAQVAFSYQRARSAAEALVSECDNNSTAAFRCELDSTASGAELIASTVSRFGCVDALIVNHGIWPSQDVTVDSMSDEQWRTTMGVNLDSVFSLVKHGVAQMKRQGRAGKIVLISSTAGQRGEAFHCDYAASKGALISMVKGLSTELASHAICVNCVAPGWVATDMSADVLAIPDTKDRIKKAIPLGRVGKPEEIAAPVLFLCTSHADFITGEIFNVNGGAVLVG
ncbi:MAG: 3-oxoacyl-[acyl-carrier-protein] reductase [Acidobacteriaceae bacterium]